MRLLPYITFRELRPGDRFRFHYYPTDQLSAETYTVIGRGWFKDTNGCKWRTSARTAVRLVD